MPSVAFEVPGVEGQRRPRASVMRGHAHVRKDDIDRCRELEIRAAFEDARAALGMPCAPADGQVSVFVLCCMPMPKGAPKRVESMPFTRKPDADNVAKSVLDALNGVAWLDDAQVTHLSVRKLERRRATRARTEVRVVWGLEDEEEDDDEDWGCK